MKKVAFILSVIFTAIIFFYGTALQTLPFIAISILTGIDIFGKKNLKVWILVLAIFMLIVNVALVSIPDVLYWAFITIVFLRK